MNPAGPITPQSLAFSAPPGARVRAPQEAARPLSEGAVDRAEVSEAAPEPTLKGAVLAAMSAFTVMASFVPTPAAAHPVAALVAADSAPAAEGTKAEGAPAADSQTPGGAAEEKSSKGTRREDEGDKHPLWGVVDGAEDGLRSAGRRIESGVKGLRGFLRDTAPEPLKEGVQDARETAQEFDKLGREGQIGEYRYTFDVIDADFDIDPKAKIRDGGLSVGLQVETEANLFRSRISKVEETPSGWRVEQGLRGGLYLKHELDLFTGVDGDGASYTDSGSTSRAELRGEAFKDWRGTWNDKYKVRFEVSPGVAQDLLHNDTMAYVRFDQSLDGGGFRFMNRDFGWTAEAREEYRYNVGEGESTYDYRVFGGVSHTFDSKLLGRKVKLETKLGPELKGNDREPFEVRPRLKVKVRW